jgi:hypothetical protein
VQISEIVMTPAHAATLLQGNTGNRTLSQARIGAIATDIANGAWQADGSPIRIAKSGKLLDGQHRLSAIVRAKQEVPVVLIEDLDEETQLTIDSGKARSFNDYLIVRGYSDHLTVATTTRLLWRYQNGDIAWDGDWNARPTATLTVLWELFMERQQEIQAAVAVGRRAGRYIRMSRSVLSVAWILLSAINFEDAEEFFAQLANERTQGSAAATLTRSMNNREGVVGRKGQIDQKWQMAYLFKAWNAFREGREISLIRWTRGGKNREPFPEAV